MEVEKIINESIGNIELIPAEIKPKLEKYIQTVETEKASLSENLTKAASDLDFQKAEAKKAFEARDEAKREAKAIKDRTGAGTYSELYESVVKEKELLSTELEAIKKEKDGFASQLDKIKEDSRNSLLATLPQDSAVKKLGESFDFKTESGMNQLKTLSDMFSKGQFAPDPGRSGEFTIDANKGWWDYTAADLDKIKEKNPDHYEKLKREMNKRK